MELLSLLKTVGALGFVIALIYGTAWLFKKLGMDRHVKGHTGKATLSVTERLMIDPRHRVVLIRRGNKEHMVLLGQTQDVLIESYDVEPTQTDD